MILISGNGISALVEQLFPGKLLSVALFIFLNRRKDHMKILYWNNDGLVIWFKRMEKGAFRLDKTETILERKEFLMLLEGIIPKKCFASIKMAGQRQLGWHIMHPFLFESFRPILKRIKSLLSLHLSNAFFSSFLLNNFSRFLFMRDVGLLHLLRFLPFR